MNSFLGTPLQVPLSPFFSSKLNFPSPFISPYATPQDTYFNQNNNEQQMDEFQNFQLDQPIEVSQKMNIIKLQPVIMKQQIKQEAVVEEASLNESIQSQQDRETSQKIKRVINVLVKCIDRDEQKLQRERTRCISENTQLGQVFDILVKKFKKLKKTKQEMTKYCMRKAFKFLADKHKKTLQCKDSGDFLKEYFQHMESEAFCVPFKKNSEDKTMNTNFLKKVFSSQTFTSDYQHFLKSFIKLVEQDNNKKIKYLSHTVKTYLNSGFIKKLETVKRLPWTQIILDKTIELANKLITHSPFYDISQHQLCQNTSKKGLKQKLIKSSSATTRKKSTLSLPETIGSPIKSYDRVHKN